MAKLKILNRYATIPNELLNDSSISLKAKGMYAFIQSKPDDWDFSAERISRQLKEGMPSVKSALQELELNGYLLRKRFQNKKGFWDVEYFLFENPKVENPMAENLMVGNPNEENPTIGKSTNISNKDFSKKESIKTIIENKENQFRLKYDSYRFKLGDEFDLFMDYWTESNSETGKLRYEKEKFFNIERRISTWMRNKSKFNNGNEPKLGTSAARMEALRNW